jgi:hypothetical protein
MDNDDVDEFECELCFLAKPPEARQHFFLFFLFFNHEWTRMASLH